MIHLMLVHKHTAQKQEYWRIW